MSTAEVNRIMRMSEVTKLTGLSKASIYRMVHSNEFAKPVRLTERTVGFVASEVHQWIDSKIEARG